MHLSSGRSPKLLIRQGRTCPCRSWRTRGSGTLSQAECCRRWTCCWRSGRPPCARSAWWSLAGSPRSAAGHRASHLERAPRTGSLCWGRFLLVPQGQVALVHLEIHIEAAMLKNYEGSTVSLDVELGSHISKDEVWILANCLHAWGLHSFSVFAMASPKIGEVCFYIVHSLWLGAWVCALGWTGILSRLSLASCPMIPGMYSCISATLYWISYRWMKGWMDVYDTVSNTKLIILSFWIIELSTDLLSQLNQRTWLTGIPCM